MSLNIIVVYVVKLKQNLITPEDTTPNQCTHFAIDDKNPLIVAYCNDIIRNL